MIKLESMDLIKLLRPANASRLRAVESAANIFLDATGRGVSARGGESANISSSEPKSGIGSSSEGIDMGGGACESFIGAGTGVGSGAAATV